MTSKKQWIVLICLAIFLSLFSVISAFAQPANSSWSSWVQQLRADAIKEGISPQTFDAVFSTIPGPSAKVIHFYQTQPEGRLTFMQYRQTRVDSARISRGRENYSKYQGLLTKIGDDYGVDGCVITALWGLETDYGAFMGNFPVVNSLATLAYASKRPDFFRHELLLALHMIQDRQVTMNEFHGEWAGASGNPQFLPSSWYKYAVDYEGTGRKNIWTSLPDSFASIANYLAKNGWIKGQPWGVEVDLPSNFDRGLIDQKVEESVGQWRSLGVTLNSSSHINDQMPASIIQLNNGPAIMVFHNFKTLQTWNESNYYVATVGYLSDKICQR